MTSESNWIDVDPELNPREKEMLRGYIDGREQNSPEPSVNRSFCYRHGFANGRDDLRGKPRAAAADLRELAAVAEMEDRLP